jgi:hypothetical protein
VCVDRKGTPVPSNYFLNWMYKINVSLPSKLIVRFTATMLTSTLCPYA